MTRLFVLSVLVAVTLAATSTANAAKHEQARKQQSSWIGKWTRIDRSIYPSINRAATIFGASASTMRTIVGYEGGNINPDTLSYSLCHATQPGWNLSGSDAFGPFQFMLGTKYGACVGQHWGTFGRFVHEAFSSAKKRGIAIPYRFKTPASNVGQAITAAYMLANPRTTGGISHWCASMC